MVLIPGALAATLLLTAAMDDRPLDAQSARHIGTGALAGVAVMGSCSTYFVLRGRFRPQATTVSPLTCYAGTILLSGGAFAYKEFYRDPKVYDDGKVTPGGYRDFAEGVGGVTAGAIVFLPLLSW